MTAGPRRLGLATALGLLAAGPAGAGHEFPFYPSFYPQEIALRVLDPAAARTALAGGALHAYAGPDPYAATTAPDHVGHAESLDAWVLVTPRAPDRDGRCLTVRRAAAALDSGRAGYRPHPFPVTPFHQDLLQHHDRIAAAAPAPPAAPPLRLRALDGEAEALVPAGVRAAKDPADATVETVEARALLAAEPLAVNGAAPPPWHRAGWYHAYRLLAGAVADPERRHAADLAFARLTAGQAAGPIERIELERGLVARLTEGCERAVTGYTVRRERLNVEYSAGVENVAHDALTGLESAVFPRTVKLKDFPWNGWLAVGVPRAPAAAWNPVAGFTDPAGRLLWAALGDPAAFPAPHGPGAIPNRVLATAVDGGPDGVPVPPEALVPEPGSGLLRPIGPGRRAPARVTYRVLGSRFHDGTRMAVADLLYALGLPARAAGDPAVARGTARLRERLVAVRVLRVDTDVLAFGEDRLTYEVPVVEVYVDHPAADREGAAAVAPPWTTVPWQVLALAEAAVGRGLAAFSAEAARTRGVPWLDLARDARLAAALDALLDDWARQGHVPAPLAGTVTPAEARARWAALRAFRRAAGHFLVTNGPYRLDRWDGGETVLQVFRDLSYPRGVGQFDVHARPLRAFVTRAAREGPALRLEADVERLERFGRDARVVREPFDRRALLQDRRSLPVCHYVALDPDGAVVAAGREEADPALPGGFRIDLAGLRRPGAHTILVGLAIDDSRTHLAVRAVAWTR